MELDFAMFVRLTCKFRCMADPPDLPAAAKPTASAPPVDTHFEDLMKFRRRLFPTSTRLALLALAGIVVFLWLANR